MPPVFLLSGKYRHVTSRFCRFPAPKWLAHVPQKSADMSNFWRVHAKKDTNAHLRTVHPVFCNSKNANGMCVRRASVARDLWAQAALLVAFEELMHEEEQRDENMFPPWLFTFLPTDQAPDDDDDENGVINGVNRSLAKLREHVDAALGSLLVRTRELDSRLEAHMAEQDQRLLSTHLDPQPVDRQDAIES